MKWEIESKVKEFVKKYNNGELVIDTSKFGHWATNDYGVNSLYTELAKAVHDFEILEPKEYDYGSKGEELNKVINLAIGHGIIKDTSRTKQIEELKEKIITLENEKTISKNTIDQLIDEKAGLKAKTELYEIRYPKLKKELEGDTEEGDVTE
jgi:vacuolar-type H+-ATPase subunit I/STV1